MNKKPFSTLYCKSKTEVVTQAYLSKSKYYQGSMRSPAKKTNDLKHRKTWVNMSSLAVFLVCPFSKNVLNTSTLKWVFDPKACFLVWNLTDDVSFPVLIQHSCPGKAVLFRFFLFYVSDTGICHIGKQFNSSWIGPRGSGKKSCTQGEWQVKVVVSALKTVACVFSHSLNFNGLPGNLARSYK